MLEQSVTIKAETVEKATKLALSKLNITEAEALVTIINEGKRGLFGFGKQDAIVEVSVKQKYSLDIETNTKEKLITKEEVKPSFESEVNHFIEQVVEQVQETIHPVEQTLTSQTEEQTSTEIPTETLENEVHSLEEVARYLEDVIRAFGAESTVTVEATSREVNFNIETDKSGLIIGKHGKIIDALQSLAQVMVHRGNRRRMAVLLNVGDYRDRRAGILESIAERTAREVLRTKQAVILDPLPAFERKQIHSHLSKIDHITTHSEGVEPNRYLVVEYEN